MNPTKWYEKSGPDGDVIRSTRIRIARNLRDYPFPIRASEKNKREIEKNVQAAFMSASSLMSEQFDFIQMDHISENKSLSLVEKHIISPDFISTSIGRAIILSKDEGISIMINEEDHIRIQVIKEGFSPKICFESADRIESLLSEKLNIAYDETWGYLTQCPTNLGTGMRVSYMMHLPVMNELGLIQRIASNLSKLGITIRGTYGEGSNVKGSLYQLSNQITLGIDEKDAVKNLTSIAGKIVEQERSGREKLKGNLEIQDKVCRAAGILKNSKLLSVSEFMELISLVTLGISTGILSGLNYEDISRLEIHVQPATLMEEENKNISPEERDYIRANKVRAICSQLKEV